MKLRVRCGNENDIITLDNDSSDVSGLLLAIRMSEKLNKISQGDFESIKVGFPPKLVDIANNALLKDVGVNNGDLLTVTFTNGPAPTEKESSVSKTDKKSSPSASQTASIPSVQLSVGYLILRNIPDDNSCIFNALAYCMFGPNAYKPDGQCPPSKLRKIVADNISANPLQYDELVLGRPVDKYIEWIQTKNAWGGAIELAILAKHFQIKINCIDIELGSIIRFQDESEEAIQAKTSIYLVYLGVHYDVVAVNKILSKDQLPDDLCKFECGSELELTVEYGVHQLCKNLQTQNYTTNTTTFRVRCLECYEILIGETGASRHANETGHYRFGEVNK